MKTILLLFPFYVLSQCPLSVIANPDFESYNCCPDLWSEMNCADSWIQLTKGTSDYLNDCDFTTDGITSYNGNGMIGGMISNIVNGAGTEWKEYAATCLTGTLSAGQTYILSFQIASFWASGRIEFCDEPDYLPLNISVYGRASCVSMQIINTQDCPTSNGWMQLDSIAYTPERSWSRLSFTIVPTFDVRAITFGAPCQLPAGYVVDPRNPNACYPYFVYDDIQLTIPCDDNQRCTIDACLMGVCTHVINPACCQCR